MDQTVPTPGTVKLLKRIECLFNSKERVANEKTWATLTAYLLPNQSGIFNRSGYASAGAGDKKTAEVFTSFPIDQAQKLTSALQGILTNQATVWSKYRESRDFLNESVEVNQYLEASNKIVHSLLNDSNFYTEVSKAYQQWVVCGNMVVFHEEKPKQDGATKYGGFKFTALHLSQVAWAENKDNFVDKVAYRYELTAEQAIEKFGDKVSQVIQEAVVSQPDRMFQFVLWIAPREASKVKVNKAGVAKPKERPFQSLVIEVNTKNVVEESGYYEFPMYVARWDMLPGETYGRGRGHLALPDIKSLNKLSKQYQKAVDKDIDPPLLMNQRDIFGAVSRNPGSRSVVKDINGYREMVSNARTDRITELYKEYQANIKAMFFIDQIILPPREDIGQMREVEVLERIKQTHTVLGPVVPRVNAEFLIPFMNRNIKMALRANILPELPEDLKETGFGLEIDVVFMNELATAQKMTTVTTIQQYMQQIAGMAQLDPTILDTINFDEIGVLEGRAMGVPETILRPEDEVQQIREARAKQQQAQAALEAANLAADTASKSSGQGQPQGGPPVA